MRIKIPDVIDAYIQASNSRNAAVPYRRVFASFSVKGRSRDWISVPEK